MRKILFISVCMVVSFTTLYAQPKADLGFFGGMSSYFGDANARNPFYHPGIALGGFLRVNLNERNAIKINVFKASIAGEATNIQFDGLLEGSSFERARILDFGLRYEFNFLPYTPTKSNYSYDSKQITYSPYIITGVGMVMSPMRMQISMGLGIKFNLNDRMSAGVEYTLHKTFTDQLESGNTSNPSPGYTEIKNYDQANLNLHNNDWYTFLGAYIALSLGNSNGGDCPVYLKSNNNY